MNDPGIWLGPLEVPGAVLFYGSTTAAAVLTVACWRKSRSPDPLVQRRRRAALCWSLPSAFVVVAGTLLWTLFIPILRTEILSQYAAGRHMDRWELWGRVVHLNMLALPIAGLPALLVLVSSPRDLGGILVAQRLSVLWASAVVWVVMMLSIDT